MDVRCLNPKIGSKMFKDGEARVRILLEVVLEASDDMRGHFLALGDLLVWVENGFLRAPRPVEDYLSRNPFPRGRQVVATRPCDS